MVAIKNVAICARQQWADWSGTRDHEKAVAEVHHQKLIATYFFGNSA
ncbi:hypothetical protein [Polaromonas sp. UBA4122]|nr:hypothetical protein [Polaromonas sp. UBA4122]